MSQITIREACLSDAPRVAGLMTQLGYPTSPHEMEERFQGILSHPDYATFVAISGEKIAGLAGVCMGLSYENNGVYGRLLALIVDEQQRGQGIGKMLVKKAEAWLLERGAHSVVVNSRLQRVGAHKFYERLGYQITGIRLVKILSRAG